MRAALADDGFLPSRKAFPGWPAFEDDERAAVEAVLRSGRVNYWTGTEGRSFESEFAAYIGVPYAVAVANGTLALELALHALGIGQGDEVIVPSRTFIGTASAVVMRGAIPVVADIHPFSQNLTATTIEPLITKRTRAIIAVHLAGWPCDMDPIMDLARRRNLVVIEDCAQAHGASYKGRPVGSIGHVGAYSFCQDKILTTGGEGGMLVTSGEDIHKRAWEYKDHGKNESAVNMPHNGSTSFRLVHDVFGTNWRLTEMQAAIGRVQLRKLDTWVAIRRHNAERLSELLRCHEVLEIPIPDETVRHSFYKLYGFVKPGCLADGWDRDRINSEINRAGVPCFTGSCPEIYLEKAFKDCGFGPKERLPVARDLGERSLMFQVHPTLDDGDITQVARVIASVLERATA